MNIVGVVGLWQHFLLLPLEVGPLESSYGVWGSAVSYPSGLWGEAPAANDFGAL